MSNYKLKYHMYLMRADFCLMFLNITNVVSFIIIAQVYRYLVLGVDAHFKYANQAAKYVLPGIWSEVISPMLWWIPLAMIGDVVLKSFIRYLRDS